MSAVYYLLFSDIFCSPDLVVQDHRFDLVENLGCSASVDPSAVGISLIWIPPLFLCTMGLIFFGLSRVIISKKQKEVSFTFFSSIAALAISNSLRDSSGHFALHLESRSTNSSFFFRSLFISMFTTVVIGLVYIFCSFFGPPLHPWSWTAVHASMFKVDIVSSQDEVGSIQLAWWGIFGITVLYLFLSFCLGEETRDIFKWIRKQVTREKLVVLPIQCVFFVFILFFTLRLLNFFDFQHFEESFMFQNDSFSIKNSTFNSPIQIGLG